MSGRGRNNSTRGHGRGLQSGRVGQRGSAQPQQGAGRGAGRGQGRGQGRTSDTGGRRGNTSTQTNTEEDSPPSPWGNSRAKKRARELLMDPDLYVHGMPATHVWTTDALFVQYDKTNFAGNYSRLKKTIETEKLCIQFDQLAFENFKKVQPRPQLTDKGVPFWDISAAKPLVIEEIKSGVLNGLTPTEVRDRHDAYKLFPLWDFRQFLNMEKRHIREAVFWQAKRNRKAQQSHDHQVENHDT